MSLFDSKIFNYLSKKIIFSFASFFVIFSVIIFGNQLFIVFTQSVIDGLFVSELIPLVTLKFIRDLPFVVSFSFSLGLIFALNNLYKSSELIIFNNAGLGDLKISKLLFPVIASFAFFVFLLTIYISPLTKNEIYSIKENAKSRPEFIFFKQGIFQNFRNNEIIFYSPSVNSNDENQVVNNPFIYSNTDNKIITAEKGFKEISASTGDVYLNLFNGNIYDNINSKLLTDSSITKFIKFTIKIFDNGGHSKIYASNKVDAISTFELVKTKNIDNLTELIYRFSVPISLVLMSVFGVIISKTGPRNKKNYSLGYGLISYIAYYNMLVGYKEMKLDSLYEVVLYSLLPHVLLFILIFLLFIFQNNFSFKRI